MPLSYRVISLIFFISISLGNLIAVPVAPLVYTEAGPNDTIVHQKDSATTPAETPPPAQPLVIRPVIGLGTGMFSYFGNITSIHSRLQNPMTSRIGYELSYTQKLSPVTEFSLYALFGKLSVNERSLTLNWNFLSEIRGGGPHLLFKILPNQPVTPYIITGVESFEYLTKSDLYDQYGNKYYYWSDGSIRNVAQNAPNASGATVIYRNYSFESDMRAMNINNSGKYSLQTFAIPFGVGFMFHIGKRADFMVGSTLHYTFTNHIDGYGDSIKSKRNDMFLMSSVSLRIEISRRKRHYDTTNEMISPANEQLVDFNALMNEDQDHDGVRDWDDSCPGTPPGVKVDAHGCPLDNDHDGVPDYRDKQPNTPAGSIVDNNGVALSDSAIKMQYLIYMDSTGEFAQIEIQNRIGRAVAEAKNTQYTVQLGRFKQGVPPDIMDKLLSVPGVQSIAMPDSSTIYTAGSYTNYSLAKTMQQQMVKSGLPDAKIVYKQGNEYIEAKAPPGQANTLVKNNTQPNGNAGSNNSNEANKNSTSVKNNNQPNGNPTNNITPSGGVIVYRVQLGAYSHKLSRDIFTNVNNLVEVKTEHGFYTYSAGSFTDYKQAVIYKTKLMTQGFPDAFIKAYKNGKRIQLKDAGATYIVPTKEDLNEDVTQPNNTLDKSQIKFKIQIGVFEGTPPAKFLARVKALSGVSAVKEANGLTHYIVGNYSDFGAAQAMRNKLASDPLLKNAFIEAYFKDDLIPLAQALSILKQ